MIVEVATESKLVCALCGDFVTPVKTLTGETVSYCLSCRQEVFMLFTSVVQVPVGCLYIGGSERLVIGEFEIKVCDT